EARKEVVEDHAEIADVVDLAPEVADGAASSQATGEHLRMALDQECGDEPALRRPHEIDVLRRSYRGPEDSDEIDEVVDPLPHRQPVLAVASGREGEAQAVDDSGHRGAVGQLELVLGDARWRVEGDVTVGVEHEIAFPMA